MQTKTLIAIVGPTASGKTNLCIQLAHEFQTEIISADSRQVFHEMNIGTAKPDPTQLEKIKHHFIDHISIHEDFNAGIFEQEALTVLEKIFSKHNEAILVGGSGLYIKALLEGLDELPPYDEQIRNQLNEELQTKGIEHLRLELKKVDPEYYVKVDLKNPHRLIRALEVFRVSGKPYSAYRKGKKSHRDFETVVIGLDPGREELYKRINQRVDEMIANGLIEEAKELFPLHHLNALDSVGYKELFQHFENKISLEEAIDLIKKNTRHFAKRQMTWFRRVENIHWFHPDDSVKILSFVRSKLHPA